VFTTWDSAGTEIVLVSAPALGSADAEWVSPQPVLSIGETAGSNPEMQFSRITDVGRLSDGRIVVLEGQGSEIRWFDADGRHLLTQGGEGGGPGEFNRAWSFVRTRGDTVVVEDQQRVKHVFFGRDGDFIGESLQDHGAFLAMGPWGECGDFPLPDQSRVVCQTEEGEPTGPAELGHHRRFNRYVRVPWDLSRIDTLGLYGGIESWGVEMGGHTRFAVHPFYSRTEISAGGDPLRIAIAVNPDYRIEIWTPEGRLERVVLRENARLAATPEEASWAKDNLNGFALLDEALVNRVRAEIPMPDSLPAIVDLVMGESGDLWVRRTYMWEPEGDAIWDVFNRRGQLLGVATLPGRFVLHEIGQDYLLGVRYDEFDVPYVEMYDLRRRGL
jgi:hypothetical protein